MGSGSSAQCKTRRCSQCQGDTEYYCNTCKHELCLQCKERHVIDLETIYHDVVIYREKYDIPNLETCVRQTDKILVYERYCYTGEFPFCAQCKKHEQNKILNIRTEYKRNREQNRYTIHRIRSETLYNNCVLLAYIKDNLRSGQTNIFNLKHVKLKMSTKAQTLKDLIDTVMCDVDVKRLVDTCNHRLKQRKRNIASIEKYEYKYLQSANRAVKLLLFLKNTFFPKINEFLYITHNASPNLTMKIIKEDVVDFLSETNVIERGQRQIRDEDQLELMFLPWLHRSVKLNTSGHITHISCLDADRIWVSERHINFTVFILINTKGDDLHHLESKGLTDNYKWYSIYGAHTVDNDGELIYIDRNNEIHKFSTDDRTKSTLIKGIDLWEPRCIYSSRHNGDLLVMLYYKMTGKVNRYDNTGQHIQTIQHDNKGQQLYRNPIYITENRNGDVVVSDFGRVVVTDGGGRHLFSYTGPTFQSRLYPHGICTDALSHILVCDLYSNTVHMIDKYGHFLSHILTQAEGINTPHSLSYDNKTHLLWVSSWTDKTVCVYSYIKRKRHKIGDCYLIFINMIYVFILNFTLGC
ncbi:uncharacterized protein LOC134261200 [Saccostrea cucullata]|uniref:uncharacterized protein LOC134261200 n=1 Tax=Saccostrea cuccullata TaxID=36930 RepID=UPI002ED12B03